MARAYGNSPLTHLAVKWEGSYGVDPGGNYQKLPFVSSDLSAGQELIPSDLIGLGRGPRDPVLDILRVGGEIVVPMDVRNVGFWLQAGLGSPGSFANTPASGKYSHRFGTDGATLPSLAIEIGMGQVPVYYLYLGCYVNTIRGDITRTGQAVLRIGIVGQSEGKSTTSQAGTLIQPKTIARLANRQGNIQRDGSDLGSITGGNWTIDNKLVVLDDVIRSDDYVDDADPGDTAFTGSIESRFASTTLYDDAVAGTALKIAAIYTIDANNKLTVQSRRVFLPVPRRSIPGPGGVTASFAWQGAHAALVPATGLAATKEAGGSLADDEYFYVVTAKDQYGNETLVSNEDSDTTETTNNTVGLTWNAVDGAVAYNVYRSTTTATYGATSLLAADVKALAYTDDGGTALSTGTPPTSSDAGHTAEVELVNDVADYTI